MSATNLNVRSWRDYELIDSGDSRKLERFGKFILIRPETQALWRPLRPDAWKRAVAEFRFENGKGAWRMENPRRVRAGDMPAAWELAWNDVRFAIRLTAFKHTGIFPEQAANWEWIAERVMSSKQPRAQSHISPRAAPRVLNLFGYTGIASIVAAQAGAQVTHVDASKQSNEWAKENAKCSEVPAEVPAEIFSGSGAGSGAGSGPGAVRGGIRYLLDDALKFAEREVRRGAVYDGIMLDPPAFGRGARGEVWKIEEQLPRLLDALAKILSVKPGAFFLLNGYAAGYSSQSFLQAVESAFPRSTKSSKIEFGELRIQESDSERVIPSGIYVRFVV